MFDSEEASNTMLTWLIRGGALFLMWLGLYMVLRPLAVIGGVVPLLGSVLAAGASAIAGLITLVAGFSSIAIAWFVYRPLIAVGLLVVVVGATVAILTAMRRSKEAPKAMPTASAPVAAESPIAGVYQENPIVSLREERQSERL